MRQSGHVANVAARAFAACGVATAGRRVVARAPADAALRYCQAAVIRHVAAALGRRLGDVAHLACGHCRLVGLRTEVHLVAVARALAVLGVGAHIVGRAWVEIRQLHTEATRTRAARRMGALRGRSVLRAPADAALRHISAAIAGHLAMGRGAFHLTRDNYGSSDVFRRRELHLLAVGKPCGILGIGSHIVGGVRGEFRDVNRVGTRACAIVGVVVVNGGLMGRAPANATACHVGTSVIGDVAAGLCRGAGDVAYLARGHRGQLGALCGKMYLIAIIHHIVAHGVGLHVVGTTRPEAGDVHQKRSRSFPALQVGTHQGIGTGNSVPAHTAHSHGIVAIGCHIATARGRSLRNVDSLRCCYRNIATARGLEVMHFLCALVLVGGVDLEAKIVYCVRFKSTDVAAQSIVLQVKRILGRIGDVLIP